MANSIRIKARAQHAEANIKTLITHPMETGLRKDPKTGQLIPAHYIQALICKHNGRQIMSAQMGPAVAKNPFVSFTVIGAKLGDSIEITWVDNRGDKDAASAKIE